MIDVRGRAGLLISQHVGTRTEEVARRWLATIQEQMAAPANAFGVDIDGSSGFALDEVGARLGFARPRIEDESVVYFGTSDEDLGFGHGVLATSDPVLFPGVPVSDETYRCLLRARAVALRSTGSRRDIEEGLRCLSANGDVLVEADPRSAVVQMSTRDPIDGDQIQGLTVFQTDSSEQIIGIRGNRQLVRISHITGEIENLPDGLRPPNMSNPMRGLCADGNTLIVSYRDGTTQRSSTELALDPGATSLTWTEDDPGFLNFAGGEPTGVLRFAGAGDRYLYCAGPSFGSSLHYKEDANPGPLGVLRWNDGGTLRNIGEIRSLSHDFALTDGRIGTGSTLYFATTNGRVWSLACDDDETNIDLDACELVVDLLDLDGFPDSGAINAMTYHDGVFYGSFEGGGQPRNFWVYSAAQAAEEYGGPSIDVHIYHPNRHYREVVARNIESLVARPAGVPLTLHTHAEP